MNILFLTRKRQSDIGGLRRFTAELKQRFPPFNWQKQIDCIHATDATLLLIGVILKHIFQKPLVVTAHGLDLTYKNPLYQWLVTMCLPHADRVILDSREALSLLHPFSYPKQRARIISPGISMNHLSKTEPIPLPDFTKRIVLLTVGNLVPRKGHAWFIREVLPHLPIQYIYVIVGDGNERADIIENTRQYSVSDRVFLLGQLSNAQLSYVFKKTHIYVAPNRHIQGNFEGFGIASGEAAARGLPVITTAVDGIPSLIHDGQNGVLVKPTGSAFVRAIRQLSDPTKRKRLGIRAKQYMQTHFLWKNTIASYQSVFLEVSGTT